jgi:hypothetical protein
MNKLILLFWIPCVVSCTTGKVETSSVDQIPDRIDSLDTENYEIVPMGEPLNTIINDASTRPDSLEAQFIANDKRVSRTADGILFQLGTGHTKLMKENRDGESGDFAVYTFLESYDSIGHWLLKGSYNESFDYLLVDQKDGESTHLWGFPVISPDKKYILAGMLDLEAGFVPNGFQLFSISGAKPILIWEKELADWGSDKLIWQSDNTVLAEQVYRDESTGELKTGIIKLRFLPGIVNVKK